METINQRLVKMCYEAGSAIEREEKQKYYIVLSDGHQDGSPHTSKMAADYHAKKLVSDGTAREARVCLLEDSYIEMKSPSHVTSAEIVWHTPEESQKFHVLAEVETIRAVFGSGEFMAPKTEPYLSDENGDFVKNPEQSATK